MKSIKFHLDLSDQLSEIPDDFTFVVGRKSFQCSKVVAMQKCQSVRILLACDPTCSTMIIKSYDITNSFQNFLDFIKGRPFELRGDNIDFFKLLAIELQCDDLFKFIEGNIGSTFSNPTLALSNVFKYINLHQQSPEKFLQFCRYELRYIAKHFGDFARLFNELAKLPLDVLDTILMDQDFSDVNMQDIIQFIMLAIKIHENDNRFYSLFAHVKFDLIQKDQAQQFFDFVQGQEISGALWLAITQRLKCDIVK